MFAVAYIRAQASRQSLVFSTRHASPIYRDLHEMTLQELLGMQSRIAIAGAESESPEADLRFFGHPDMCGSPAFIQAMIEVWEEIVGLLPLRSLVKKSRPLRPRKKSIGPDRNLDRWILCHKSGAMS